MSQHAQHQDPEPEAAKRKSAIINVIIYTSDFPSVPCQNIIIKMHVEKLSAMTSALSVDASPFYCQMKLAAYTELFFLMPILLIHIF